MDFPPRHPKPQTQTETMTNIKPTPFTVGQVFIYQGVIAIKVVSVQADGCTGEDLESPGNLYGFTEEHRADLVEKV